MHQIDWYGNGGRANPAHGTVETVYCGVCGFKMEVKRNVIKATSYAEAVAGKKHSHDQFTCPNLKKGWHREIYLLKTDMYMAEINGDIDYEEKKNVAETMIVRILETHAVR